ncbi:LutC/YkgG family protein [Desulfatirhabdium butyrativorans]|uniref:LutC/YkgG family protein n=1 Tax=Desulfatirhabdium butyrativorans TaxID=340467 RepID=UPI00040D0164|nr:LUD domain-containing protein [Desulfatirhabdium butyrativorans]
MPQSDCVQKLMEKAQLVQAVAKRVSGLQEVADYTCFLLGDAGGKSGLAVVGFPESDQAFLESAFSQKGIGLLPSPLRERMRDIRVALTPCAYAIAETGSLVLLSQSEDLRLASMLSDTHVVCVNPESIFADAFSFSETLRREIESGCGYVSFITGASRTADIERVLAIGVHGPQELHILLMEGRQS